MIFSDLFTEFMFFGEKCSRQYFAPPRCELQLFFWGGSNPIDIPKRVSVASLHLERHRFLTPYNTKRRPLARYRLAVHQAALWHSASGTHEAVTG